MSKSALNVIITRPKQTPAKIIGRLAGGVIGLFLAALLVWLITPHVWADYPLTYWQTLGAVYVLRIVTSNGHANYLYWSRGWSEPS